MIKKHIGNIVASLVPFKIVRKVFLLKGGKESKLQPVKEPDPTVEISFSQDGEDIILKKILAEVKNGFYVDIGAYHPKLYSNTYSFYLAGWRGINIDPRPGIKELFEKERERDINLEMGVGNRTGEMDYFIFNEPGVNTFDKEVALGRNKILGYKLKEVRSVEVDTIVNIFNKYVKDKIDFLTIDVEGYEYEILRHNDWRRYRPKVILAEIMFSEIDLNFSILKNNSREYWVGVDQLGHFPIHQLLTDNGYKVLAKTIATVFYVDTESDL